MRDRCFALMEWVVDGVEVPSGRFCERAVPADTEAISQALCIALYERMLYSAWEETRGVCGGAEGVTVRQAVSCLSVSVMCVFCCVCWNAPPETGGRANGHELGCSVCLCARTVGLGSGG